MEYTFHDDARQEFLDSAAFYESKVLGLGDRFVNEVNRSIQLLLATPEIGSPNGGVLRSLVIDDNFPFSIIYAIVDETLFIIAIAHHSRRPNYWKNRTKSQRG